jgi:hypothetical protein
VIKADGEAIAIIRIRVTGTGRQALRGNGAAPRRVRGIETAEDDRHFRGASTAHRVADEVQHAMATKK